MDTNELKNLVPKTCIVCKQTFSHPKFRPRDTCGYHCMKKIQKQKRKYGNKY